MVVWEGQMEDLDHSFSTAILEEQVRSHIWFFIVIVTMFTSAVAFVKQYAYLYVFFTTLALG